MHSLVEATKQAYLSLNKKL